jgi:formyltetrahydrofolate deformylase
LVQSEAGPQTAILLVDCPDRKGIVAAIANFLYQHGANILHADQHQDYKLGLFFMRVEWDLRDFDLDPAAFRLTFKALTEECAMN